MQRHEARRKVTGQRPPRGESGPGLGQCGVVLRLTGRASASEAEHVLTIEHIERTSTGERGVVLRPLEPGDRAPLLEIFSGLSPRSRRQRFLTPKTRLTEADLRQLTSVDDHD